MAMEIGRAVAPMQPVQPAQQIRPIEQQTQENEQKQGADLTVTANTNGAAQQTTDKPQDNSTFAGAQSARQNMEEQIEQDNEKVMKAISEMNKKMTSNTEAVFGIHEDTNRITIKLVDRTTKETIKELPPEKTLDMIAKVWEMAGMLVDERK